MADSILTCPDKLEKFFYPYGLIERRGNIIRKVRINQQIRIKEIRVVGANGEQLGVLTLEQGLKLAEEKELDLVEVAPEVRPPVCRIMNYGKFKYDQQKKEKEARKKQKSKELKEIKLHANIGEHDYQVKLRSAQKFLQHSNRIKLTMIFRGREMTHLDLGRKVVDRLVKDLEGPGQVEKGPFRMGRFLITIIVPK